MDENTTMRPMNPEAATENRWKLFGAWLRRERERTGKSQKEVAAAIGLHAVHLSRIETGESGTKPDTLDLLIGTLGLDRGEAYRQAGFWPEGTKPPATSEADDFDAALATTIAVFRTLPPPQRQRLLKVLMISFGNPEEFGPQAFELSDPADFSKSIAPGGIDQAQPLPAPRKAQS